jgi:hypothetical protein
MDRVCLDICGLPAPSVQAPPSGAVRSASRLERTSVLLACFCFFRAVQDKHTHDSSLSPCRAFPALPDRVGAFQPSCPYPYHDWKPEILVHLFPAMPETRRLLEAACALSHALRAQGVPHAFHGNLFVAVLANSPQADVRLPRRSSPDGTAFGDLITVQEIFCIVEGGTVHPFRRVRQALTGNADLSITPSPWTNRYTLMHFRLWLGSVPLKRWRFLVQAARKIQPLHPSSRGNSFIYSQKPVSVLTCFSSSIMQIEILAAGETGPRRLDALTVAIVSRVPFLTTSEFVRAKMNAWMMYVTCYAPVPHAPLLTVTLMSSPSRGSERDAQDIVFIMTRYWNSIDINRIPEHDMDRFVEMVGAAAPGWAAIKRKYGM